MLLYWVWLSMRTAVTEREKWLLLQHFHDPEDLYFAEEEGLRELNMRPESLASLLDKDLSAAQKVIDDCVNKQIEICTMQDPQYPVRLKNIPDPPCVLYYKGDLGCMTESLCIAVVGTRKATPYGLKMARKIAFQMASCGAVIVSGLAEGIDGAGATGGIMANGNVVGVLGCGLDRVYPAFHKNLYEQTRHSGCLISEFPPGTPPYKWNFPKRNRIISGLSNGVLVVEAPKKSGALLTARDAAEHGRDVFCVPGNLDMDTFVGSNALLREGAIMATCGADVIGEYAALYPDKLSLSRGHEEPIELDQAEIPLPKVAERGKTPAKTGHKDRKTEKKPVDKGTVPPYSDIQASLSPEEARLVELLRAGECLADEASIRCDIPAAKLAGIVTMLQIKGILVKKPGNILALK